MKRPRARHLRGFTLIEILVVIVILAILVALLLPSILGAIARARDAAVTSEISNLGQALADFKTRFGDYPPSRIILSEAGALDTTSTVLLSQVTWYGNTQPVIAGNSVYGSDMTYGQLAQRSLRFFKKFWPRVQFSPTSTSPSVISSTFYYDFNGNGSADTLPIYLEGHEALAFFLGGVPNQTKNSSGFFVPNMTGWSKFPTNPFVSMAEAANVGGNMLSAQTNRQPPFFEFRNDRLIDDDGDGLPGYVDTIASGTEARYYAYFASYGGGGYDPNDVNFLESNDNIGTTAWIGRAFRVTFQIGTSGNTTNLCGSPAPNPYTSTAPVALTAGGQPALQNPVSFQNPETFQIISAGRDRLYGVGGEYLPNTNGERLPLPPVDLNQSYNSGGNLTDPNGGTSVRIRERDNLTNFSTSRLD